MADLPEASVAVDDAAGAPAGNTNLLTVFAAVATNADMTPRVFASGKALLDEHSYSDGASYVASHIDATRKPVLFLGLPIATAGVLGSHDSTGVTGTCKITVAAAASGVLAAVDAVVTVTRGGIVGTDQIVLALSLDGGRTSKTVRLGTALTYTIPYVGLVLSFATGATLVAGDVYSFRSTSPMWDNTGLSAAKTALAAQSKLSRSWLVIGDLPNSTFAGYVTTAVNGYETTDQRFTYARASVKDRLPLAKKSKVVVRMSGAPSLTFAEVGATGDTITRATGSWITDGFVANQLITVANTALNNFTDAKITAVSATVLTLDTQDLTAEVTSAATVIGSEAMTFAEVGVTGDTITRSTGSWVADGFAAGMKVAITGTASNNITTAAAITTVTATVMTLDTDDLAAEVIAGHRVSVVQVLTKAAWIAAEEAAFASVDSQPGVDLSAGRAAKICPITGWEFRRPASWAASIREYQHDLQIPCWRKADGPLDGWDLEDADGNVSSEFDERTDGGALAARFTCFRTYANGPRGAFIALSMTRADEATLRSRTHNAAVVNLARTIIQTETENAIGQVLQLNADGTGTEASLKLLEGRVNTALRIGLLQNKAEGPRASGATWSASRTDILNTPGAELTGSGDLILNGTLEKILTRLRVR